MLRRGPASKSRAIEPPINPSPITPALSKPVAMSLIAGQLRAPRHPDQVPEHVADVFLRRAELARNLAGSPDHGGLAGGVERGQAGGAFCLSHAASELHAPGDELDQRSVHTLDLGAHALQILLRGVNGALVHGHAATSA